jgi:hypothetical protein
MQKMQEDAAVLAHRTGYVEQCHKRRRPGLRPDEAQIDEVAAALHARAQSAADIDQVTMQMRGEPSCAQPRERQRQTFDRVLGGGDLGRGHLREVFSLQHFAVRHGHAGIEFDAALFFQFVFEAGEQRLVHARRAGCWRLRRRWRLRQHHRQKLIDIAPPAEKDAERLIEQDRMFVPLHEDGMQRPVKIFARTDARNFESFERLKDHAGADGDARGAQRAGEIDNVFGEPAGIFCHRISPPLVPAKAGTQTGFPLTRE